MASTLMSEIQQRDKFWPGGWQYHLCPNARDENGFMKWCTHSIHYHHPHDLCCDSCWGGCKV